MSSEEAEILREMIADRESRIAVIQRKTNELSQRKQTSQEELDKVQALLSKEQEQRQAEISKLLQEKSVVETQLLATQRDFQQQGSSLHIYAGVLRQDQMGDSSYIMRMQAQLCKAMHSMGIVDHQSELASKHSESLIKLQKDTLGKLTEEQCQIELQLMNELMGMDTEIRQIEDTLGSKLDGIRKEIEDIEKQIEENQDSDDEEDDEDEDEEDDEEEKEIKEELMNLLKERKEEIAALEKKEETQQDTIEEMQVQLEELRNAETVVVNERMPAEVDDGSDSGDEQQQQPDVEPEAAADAEPENNFASAEENMDDDREEESDGGGSSSQAGSDSDDEDVYVDAADDGEGQVERSESSESGQPEVENGVHQQSSSEDDETEEVET